MRPSSSPLRPSARPSLLRDGVALSLALLVLLVVVHLPWQRVPRHVGWYLDRPPPASEAHPMRTSASAPDAPPATRGLQAAGVDRGVAPERARAAPASVPDAPDPERMRARRVVLEHAEHMPHIRGGIGAYYIHIEYPPAAVAAGIEGRLVLRFVVDVEGLPGAIEVVEPLHPLCDSAAVRALRQTRFVPGRQGDQYVPVRMYLPVRFRLVGPPGAR